MTIKNIWLLLLNRCSDFVLEIFDIFTDKYALMDQRDLDDTRFLGSILIL